MAESVKISELSELASQLLATDYIPIVRSGDTYKYAPYGYVVKNTGNETIAGVKTFSSSPIVPTADASGEAVNFGQVVKNSGDETVAGIKTFSSSPIVPTATTPTQAANLGNITSAVTPLSDLSRVMQINGDGVPVFPDNVAERTYWQDDWVTTDGWTSGGGSPTVSVSGGKLIVTATASLMEVYKIGMSIAAGKIIRIKLESSASGTVTLLGYITGQVSIKSIPVVAGVPTTLDAMIPTGNLYLYISRSGCTAGDSIKVDTIYIGSGLYDTPVYDKACCNRATNYGVLPVKGPRGQALSLNGGQYLQFDNPVLGATGTKPIYWKRGRIGVAETIVSNQSATTNGIRYHIDASNNLYALFGGTSPVSVLIKSGWTDTTSFHSFGVVISGTTATPFYDGVFGAAVSVTSVAGIANLTIGRNPITSDAYAIGSGFFGDYTNLWTQADVTRYHNGDDAVDSQAKSNSGTPHAIAVYNASGFLGNTTPMLSLSAGVIGATSTVDILSGGTLTIPSGSGYYAWIILTYGVTINSVTTGYNSAGATVTGTASGNCRVLLIRLV